MTHPGGDAQVWDLSIGASYGPTPFSFGVVGNSEEPPGIDMPVPSFKNWPSSDPARDWQVGIRDAANEQVLAEISALAQEAATFREVTPPSSPSFVEIGWVINQQEPLLVVAPSQSEILLRLQGICKSLKLGTAVAAKMIGIERRWFYALLEGGRSAKGKSMPLPDLWAASSLVDKLNRFYASQPELLATYLKRNTEEGIRLLSSGRYRDFSQRLADLELEQTVESKAVPPLVERPPQLQGEALRQAIDLLNNPSLDAVLALLSPRTKTALVDKAWRVAGRIELTEAYEKLDAFEPVPDKFEFLLTLSQEEIATFVSRANGILDDEAQTPDAWQDFLQQESSRAMIDYSPYIATIAPARRTDPDLGLDPVDEVEFFRSIGVDLATGRISARKR